MTLETWLAFATASLILTMTPGPSILLGVAHSLNYGVRKTLFTALGDITANFLQMVIVVIGLGVIISQSEIAFEVIRWFGVITLLYMGLKMILTRGKITLEKTSPRMSRRKMFISGFLVAAGNPKAIVFFTAFFPQFLNPNESLWLQMAILCPTIATLDFFWVMAYAMGAKQISQKMINNPAIINIAGGSALVGASGFIAFSSKNI